MTRRPALNVNRIIEAAVRTADRGGLARVSMRNVSRELGVEAMSLYHHLAGKDALLDGLADWVFTQIETPDPRQLWRPAMVERAASARQAMSQHPWALGLIESRRTPGPALLGHHEAVLACLRNNGFTYALAAHAHSAIDAYVFGFVLAELNLPFDADEGAEGFVREIQPQVSPERYPHLVQMMAELVIDQGFDYAREFEFGLDLILDGLGRCLAGTALPVPHSQEGPDR